MDPIPDGITVLEPVEVARADEDEKAVRDLLRNLCDGLNFSPVDQERREILRHVRKPDSINKAVYLSKRSPTYHHRLRLTQTFLSELKKQGEKITETESFHSELETFIADNQGFCSDQDLLGEQSSWQVPGNVRNWLEEGCSEEIHGIVLRKSQRYTSLLVVNAESNTNKRSDEETEIVIPLQHDFRGFGVVFKIGDVISVRLDNVVKERRVVNTSLKSCIGLTDDETEHFLQKIIETYQSEGAAVALSTILRCFAVWSHIVSERCRENMSVTERVLSLCTNIVATCTQHSYKISLEKLCRPFVETTFLSSTLKQFIATVSEAPGNRITLARTFVHHVIKIHPKCGLIVLPLAQQLLYSTTSGTMSEDFKTGGLSNEEFLIQLCTSLASKVPKAFEVNDPGSLPWTVMPLILLPSEIENFKYTRTAHLPKVRRGTNGEKKYDSVSQYLHTNFMLLREECFFKLKKGILGFLRGGLDPKDMALYRVSLNGVKIIQQPYIGGLSLVLSFKFNDPAKNSDLQNIDWESFQWLKHGNLLCLSLDNTFRQPIWACVSGTDKKDRGFVSVTMFSDRNMQADLNVAEVLCKLQELKDKGVEAYMAESHTFYTAFGHALEVLQERDKVPFQDSLVFAEVPGPAPYITKAEVHPDWSGIFSSEDLAVQEACDSLLTDFEEKKKDTKIKRKLDETQLAAVESALNHKLALIQGPPGTGKTHVGLALVKLLLSVKKGQKLGPILVVTYKNLALNHFLTKCLEMLPQETRLVRIGKNWEDTEGELKNCTIEKVSKRINVKRGSTRKICTELEDIEIRLLSLANKLQQANIFSSTVFREVAEDGQIFHLLAGDDKTPGVVEHAEAERLVYHNSTATGEGSDQELDDHIASSLQKWLPAADRFYRLISEDSRAVPAEELLGDNSIKSGKSKESDRNETQEDSVGSCLEHSAEERERLEALGDEYDEDQHMFDRSRESSAPVQGRLLPSLPDETLSQCKHLLNTVNPWKLNEEERVQLAHALQKQFRDKVKQEFLQAHRGYKEKREELQLLKREFDARVLKKCDIIGMTVTGAAMRSDILSNVQPSIMIVEEAAEVLEAQLLAAIPPSVQHLIMIGDHKQLKPQVHHQRLRKSHYMDLSMFERLANCGLPLQQLGYQCRMRREFADLLNKLKLYQVALKTNEKLVANNYPPNCIKSSMFFQTHNAPEEDTPDSHSKFNQREVVHVTKVAKHLYTHGYNKNKITVLCSYRGQVGRIIREFELSGLQGIEVTTIDSFQGQEQDFVLISLVRSRGRIGYLSSLNRLCVAISRARCGMYLFGNDLTLSSNSPSGWKKIIDAMGQQKLTGAKFPFVEPEEQVKESTRNVFWGLGRGKDVVDDEVLRCLASEIVPIWKKIGRALGLKETDLEIIEEDNRHNAYERDYAMLQKWKQSRAHEATLEALALALTHETVERGDLAEKYCYANFSGKPKQRQSDRPSSVGESSRNMTRENQAPTAACGEGKPTQVATREETRQFETAEEARTPTQVDSLSAAMEGCTLSSGPIQDTSGFDTKNDAINVVPDDSTETIIGATWRKTEHCGTAGANKAPASSEHSFLSSEQYTLTSELGNRTTHGDMHSQKYPNDPVQETLQPQEKGAPLEEMGDLSDVEKKPHSETGSPDDV